MIPPGRSRRDNLTYFCRNVKVLGKCQLKDTVQEKTEGLDSAGEFSMFSTEFFKIFSDFDI